MQLRTIAAATLGLVVLGCRGPTGPEGPQGPEGPMFEIDAALLIGSWQGDMLVEDGTGGALVPAGVRQVTFAPDGSYTSDIFTDGGPTQSGEYLAVGTSIVVSVPNPNGSPYLASFQSVAVRSDSLKFVVDIRPQSSGFTASLHTIYLLARN